MAAGGGRSIFTKFGEKMNAPPQRLVSFEYHFSLLAVVVVVVVVANFLSPYLRVCTSGVDGKVKVRVWLRGWLDRQLVYALLDVWFFLIVGLRLVPWAHVGRRRRRHTSHWAYYFRFYQKEKEEAIHTSQVSTREIQKHSCGTCWIPTSILFTFISLVRLFLFFFLAKEISLVSLKFKFSQFLWNEKKIGFNKEGHLNKRGQPLVGFCLSETENYES